MKKTINLTPFEKKVLEAMYNTSLDNKGVAELLGLSVSSVKIHSHNIYKKLGVGKRIHLKDLKSNDIKCIMK